MIRSVSRAAARLASKPTTTSTITATATRTSIFRTLTPTITTTTPSSSFASKSTSSSKSSDSTSLSSTNDSSAPPPANLRSLKRDITRLIDEDTRDLATAPDQGLLDYVKEQNMRITQDKDGVIKLARTVGDYNVSVQFMAEVDEEQDEMGGPEDPEGKEKEEGEDEEGGEGEENESRLPPHQWEVEVTNTVAPQHNIMRLNCLTSKQGQYSIEAINFEPSPNNTTSSSSSAAGQQPSAMDLGMEGPDPRKQLFFDELSEGAQDKMFELMESIGVDDKLGQFVQHYAQVVRTQVYLDKLKMLKQFLQQ